MNPRVTAVFHCERVYRLSRPVAVRFSDKAPFITIDLDRLGIHAYGMNEREAWEALRVSRT